MPTFDVTRRRFLLALALFASAGCSSPGDRGSEARPATRAANEPPIMVFAAASMTDVLTTIGRLFEERRGIPVRTSFAASSALAKQIEQGAAADVFISADPAWMDYVAERHLIVEGTRVDLVSNTLVLVAPKGMPFTARLEMGFDLANAFRGRLALGDPEHVPAGRYARAALEHFGWWATLQPRVIPVEDVRAALQLVALGEAAAGIVYGSDAAISDKVVAVGTFPADSHPIIRYPVAACSKRPGASELVAFLRTPEAAAVFRAAGFAPHP